MERRYDGVEYIQEIILRDQFRVLRRILHWTTDNHEEGVGEVEQTLRGAFSKWWKPFQHVVVDEGIIPFKGHVKWRQHVKNKPHSTGVKDFAAANDSGFVYDFFLFADFCSHVEKAAGIPKPH